jgi:tetratricopeptide (TPR) repeat protein
MRALSDPSSATIKKAIARVNRMLAKDLGAFLFDDAWQRLELNLRHLLLIMVRVADVHDAVSLRLCCMQVDVPVSQAEAALGESAGIASVTHVNGGIQIEFSPNFIRFAESKKIQLLDGSTVPTDGAVARVKQQYSDYLRSARRSFGDRIPQAFQHPLAKAAHIAADDGRIDDSRHYYEQAVLADPTNGWLFDRYAYFLFKNYRELESALRHAHRATELLPEQDEPWFTRGMIEARLGLRSEFESSFARAEKFGASRLRCALQRAWGYVRAQPPQLALARRETDLARLLIREDRWFQKNSVEISRLEERISYLEEASSRRGQYKRH